LKSKPLPNYQKIVLKPAIEIRLLRQYTSHSIGLILSVVIVYSVRDHGVRSLLTPWHDQFCDVNNCA